MEIERGGREREGGDIKRKGGRMVIERGGERERERERERRETQRERGRVRREEGEVNTVGLL